MPRLEPTNAIDIIGDFDILPEQSVGEYIASKKQDDFFMKPPNADAPGDSLELLYVHIEQEHGKMMKLQEEMLQSAQEQKVIKEARIKEMYKNHATLHQRFIEVNHFIKECNEKRLIAENHIAEQDQKHAAFYKRIEDLKKKIEELSTFSETLHDAVKEFEPYEKVIEEVVEISSTFESVQDCMQRCDALMLAQGEINQMENDKINEIEILRKRMVSITSDAALRVLGLKNELAQMERDYFLAKNGCIKWEGILNKAKTMVSDNILHRERALEGIRIAYRILCKRRGIPEAFERHQIEKQVNFIRNEMHLLFQVLKECKKVVNEEKKKGEFKKGQLKCPNEKEEPSTIGIHPAN